MKLCVDCRHHEMVGREEGLFTPFHYCRRTSVDLDRDVVTGEKLKSQLSLCSIERRNVSFVSRILGNNRCGRDAYHFDRKTPSSPPPPQRGR